MSLFKTFHLRYTTRRQRRITVDDNRRSANKGLAAIVILILVATSPVSSVMKQHYGGNVKISEDLATGLEQIHLFEAREDSLHAIGSFQYVIEQNRLEINLANLTDDKISELEGAIVSVQETTHPCHWVLDYPYFHHEHANRLTIEHDRLILTASEPDFLNLLVQSSCLIPERVRYLMPFARTQFGYEANQTSIEGRPFLDSISPVAIDPLNPYLAFKLNEVDVFAVPEEKFRQISSDEQIQILAGPDSFLYLKTENLTAGQMLNVTAAIDLREISRAVLNDHAVSYIEPANNKPNLAAEVPNHPIYLKIPNDFPYRLIGERLRIQLQNRGFVISTKGLPKSYPAIELRVRQVREPDMELFRYNLLRQEFQPTVSSASFEEWDELQASGRLVSLMLYQSRIAVRKNLSGIRRRPDGLPDFSNAWMIPTP
jgi:hypothetical protein